MSREWEHGENSHIYGFPNRVGHDRHLQSIIDHTNSLFPDHTYRLPQLNLSNNPVQESLPNPLTDHPDDGSEEANLDDFDRELLGQSKPSSTHLPGSDSRSQRLSLPLNSSSSRPQRVLGDASHHFRPFVPREADYRSPFPTNPINLDPLEPTPSTQPMFARDVSHRVKELQPGTQLFTPPYYSSKTTPPLNSSLTDSSPSNPNASSPSTRLSLKKQTRVAHRPSVPSKWSQKVQLDLDHAPSAPPVVNNTRLVDPRQALPDRFRSVFPYELFNAVQSKCFPLVYGAKDNVVISAPTGSGKTAILEMAICELVASQGSENFKIVYQAPTKSLCSERARDWEKKFSHMDLKCIELTGDTSNAQANRVGSASIIVTTPEKWDSITRKWSDHRRLLEMIRLVLIDEVHILKDARGATLEAVVSRMKTIGAQVRFVALSATLPNIEDIAKWLGRDHGNQNEPARYEAFGEELRPVKLQRYVYGYGGGSNDFIFEQQLDGKLTTLLAKHSEGKPIMVFCFTRKSCQRTAQILAEWWSTCQGNDKAWPAPTQRIPVISQELREIVRYGVAFHHAGLDSQDRSAVEQNYLKGQLHVICCTSTLAVGVNLPCHTVVLKGTTGYSDGGPQEYSDLEVMQMCGRAGRPQFDKSAVAIIMTRLSNAERYEKMTSGQEMLESTLHLNLIEHLNSEIGLGTIQDIQTAKKWVGGTFLSVRVRQSPSLYNLDNVHNAAGADEKMAEWCERDVKHLQEYGLITKHTPFSCTEYGRAMSRYMVQFETMKLLLSISRGAKIEEMITTICKAAEFKEFRFRPAERAVFRDLNKSSFILHPIKETLTQTWHKVSMIVQIHLGGVELPNDKDIGSLRLDLAKEKTLTFDRLNRLVRCIVDCKVYDGDGIGTKAGLELARAIAANSWDNKPSQLSQIPGFGPVAVRKWISQGVHTVLGLADKSSIEIERVAIRNPPYGRNVLKTLQDFPRLTMKVELLSPRAVRQRSEEPVSVTLRVNLGHCNAKSPPSWANKVPTVTFMALTTDGNLAQFWRGNMRQLDKTIGLDLKFPVALTAPNQKIICYFSCEEIVGTQVERSLEPKIPPSAFRNVKSKPAGPSVQAIDSSEDDLGDGDVADEDMLNMFDPVSHPNTAIALDYPGPMDGIEDDFPLIDDLLSRETTTSAAKPGKMPNGKWMCNHDCVDKPRPPPQKKDGRTSKGKAEEHQASSSDSQPISHPKSPQHSQHTKGSQRTSREAVRIDTVPISGTKRGTNDLTVPTSVRSDSKRLKFTKPVADLHSLPDVEYIDLSKLSDDESDWSAPPKKLAPPKGKQRQKLSHLQEKTRGNVPTLPRLKGRHGAEDTSSGVLSDREPSSGHDEFGIGPDQENANPLDDSYAFELEQLPDLPYMPDLDDLLYSNEPQDNKSSQKRWETDETLYPGVAQTLRESMDYG
ncbi:Uu.00g130760.m01.CDS01 [Anthostomella pinea]|uniref:DNA 3'-5' helicase n=1 Tax=Anthostomella pinea TaxID=933095 RepID=A0AAI8VIU4_9PEZI|nr:Uu.00g130760.m01.CDS01 [Anthostomella pinea]